MASPRLSPLARNSSDPFLPITSYSIRFHFITTLPLYRLPPIATGKLLLPLQLPVPRFTPGCLASGSIRRLLSMRGLLGSLVRFSFALEGFALLSRTNRHLPRHPSTETTHPCLTNFPGRARRCQARTDPASVKRSRLEIIARPDSRPRAAVTLPRVFALFDRMRHSLTELSTLSESHTFPMRLCRVTWPPRDLEWRTGCATGSLYRISSLRLGSAAL